MAQDPAIRQMPVEDLETTFEHLGVTLTALGEGRTDEIFPGHAE